jgi:hypothetical protein
MPFSQPTNSFPPRLEDNVCATGTATTSCPRVGTDLAVVYAQWLVPQYHVESVQTVIVDVEIVKPVDEA